MIENNVSILLSHKSMISFYNFGCVVFLLILLLFKHWNYFPNLYLLLWYISTIWWFSLHVCIFSHYSLQIPFTYWYTDSEFFICFNLLVLLSVTFLFTKKSYKWLNIENIAEISMKYSTIYLQWIHTCSW